MRGGGHAEAAAAGTASACLRTPNNDALPAPSSALHTTTLSAPPRASGRTVVARSGQSHSGVVASGGTAALGVQEGGAAVRRHHKLAAKAVSIALRAQRGVDVAGRSVGDPN